jgi:hypothetical protein
VWLWAVAANSHFRPARRWDGGVARYDVGSRPVSVLTKPFDHPGLRLLDVESTRVAAAIERYETART